MLLFSCRSCQSPDCAGGCHPEPAQAHNPRRGRKPLRPEGQASATSQHDERDLTQSNSVDDFDILGGISERVLANLPRYQRDVEKRLALSTNALGILLDAQRGIRRIRDAGRLTANGRTFEAKRNYQRTYMRKWRKRKREAKLGAKMPPPGAMRAQDAGMSHD